MTIDAVRARIRRIWIFPIWRGEYEYGQIPMSYYDDRPICWVGTRCVYAFSLKRCEKKLLKLYEEELKFVKGEDKCTL